MNRNKNYLQSFYIYISPLNIIPYFVLKTFLCDINISTLKLKKLSLREVNIFIPEVEKLETLNSKHFLLCSVASFELNLWECILFTKL